MCLKRYRGGRRRERSALRRLSLAWLKRRLLAWLPVLLVWLARRCTEGSCHICTTHHSRSACKRVRSPA